MNENQAPAASAAEEYYEKNYLPRVNRVGKITGALGVLLSFSPAIVLLAVFKILPPGGAVLTAFVGIASAVGVLWFVEPISYFPVLGVTGTYMAFLSGNISNMRLPCAAVAQDAAGVKPGTAQGAVVSALGMAVSVLINIAVLTVGVLLGSAVLAKLPPVVQETLNYLLPALFGALLAQFGFKNKRQALIMLAFAIVINLLIGRGAFAWLPGAANYLAMLSCVFVSILIARFSYKKRKAAN
ncbi:MAG: hypothetical protein LKJ80_03980 [Oscillibacter sp.]|jgi:hypothetical protein|nr:hypothetical protein [Oscillibacter sp.]